MPHLAQQCNSLQPAKTFFDALPFLLAEAVGGMLRSAPINGAAAATRQVFRHVWRYAHVPALPHKIRGIKSVVAAHGHAPRSRNLLHHGHRRIELGGARGSHTRLDTINPWRFSTIRLPL